MPRHLLGLFAVAAIAAAVALAIARPGALSNDGSFAQPAAAVADAEPTATPWAYIDKVNNGEGWCDPDRIDSTTTEYVGDSHQLAVCVGNLPAAVYAFHLAINYDGALDRCIEEECILDDAGLSAQRTLVDGEGCLDDNPDANAGDTVWGDGLGDGWNCSFLNGDSLAASEIIITGSGRAGLRRSRSRCQPPDGAYQLLWPWASSPLPPTGHPSPSVMTRSGARWRCST